MNVSRELGIWMASALLAAGFSATASAATIDVWAGPNLGLAIADNDANGISTRLNIARAGTIDAVRVEAGIDHTWVGDVFISLRAPDGTVAVLSDRPGAPASRLGDNSDLAATSPLLFDDNATTAAEDMGAACNGGNAIVGADCVGAFVAESLLSTFDGLSMLGDWTLTVSDNANQNLGILDSWSLSVDYTPASVPLPPAAWLLGGSLLGLVFVRRRRH